MSEMVERVGAALRKECEAVFGSSWSNDNAWRFARAAIEAMRNPTQDMIAVPMKTYKNDMSEVYACDSYDRLGLGVHDTKTPDTRARYALDLIKTLSVPLMLDGHPGATRMTPAEVAKTAADLAKATFDELNERGWMIEVPSMEALREEARENRGRN